MHEQTTIEFGVRIVGGKDLNWCTPFSMRMYGGDLPKLAPGTKYQLKETTNTYSLTFVTTLLQWHKV